MNRTSADRVLAAARELFARHGYEGTSIRAITTRARANLGAVTYHFGSKRSLYYRVIESLAEPLVDGVATTVQQPAPALDRVEAVVRAFFGHVGQHPELPRLMLRELAAQRSLSPPAMSAMGRNIAALVTVIAAGQATGAIRAGEPKLLALTVFSQAFYFAVAMPALQGILGTNWNDLTARGRIVDHVVAAVRGALAPSQVTP